MKYDVLEEFYVKNTSPHLQWGNTVGSLPTVFSVTGATLHFIQQDI